MPRVSPKENKTVYQLAREELSLSRAEAVDKMEEYGMTEDRLTRVENEMLIIHPEDVVAMSKGYNKPELRNYYCCNECPIGKIDAPEVMYKDNVHQILVNMVVSLETVNQKKSRLMEILADGEVDATEEKDFAAISEELERISAIVESLQLWCEKMKATDKE